MLFPRRRFFRLHVILQSAIPLTLRGKLTRDVTVVGQVPGFDAVTHPRPVPLRNRRISRSCHSRLPSSSRSTVTIVIVVIIEACLRIVKHLLQPVTNRSLRHARRQRRGVFHTQGGLRSHDLLHASNASVVSLERVTYCSPRVTLVYPTIPMVDACQKPMTMPVC